MKYKGIEIYSYEKQMIYCTLFLNVNLSVWIWVPEQTLTSNPRESRQISCASCNKLQSKWLVFFVNNGQKWLLTVNNVNVHMLVHKCYRENETDDKVSQMVYHHFFSRNIDVLSHCFSIIKSVVHYHHF